ncbi:MAG: hypothetical protein ACRDMV_21005 [Streptosporangiales bacterium]
MPHSVHVTGSMYAAAVELAASIAILVLNQELPQGHFAMVWTGLG